MTHELLQEVTEVLTRTFGVFVHIISTELLSAQDRRNTIMRIMLEPSKNQIPKSIILKQSLPEESDIDDKEAYARFARDWCGLEFISALQKDARKVPQFYGASKKHRFILIEDLGSHHISLVDSLTRSNQDQASSALNRFMKALSGFHATSFGHTEQYSHLLRKINHNANPLLEDFDVMSEDLISKMKDANKALHLPVSDALIKEARQIMESMMKPGPFTVLLHGDICPDNVFDNLEKQDMQLFDFEYTFPGNALLEATYLRMSMPTCWCSKAIPDAVIKPLETIYRDTLKQSISEASNDLAYNTAYTKACAFWILQKTLTHIESIMEYDKIGHSGPTPKDSLWKDEENTVRPRVISRLEAFIAVANQHNQLPQLKEMASNILAKLKKCWPDAKPLDYYSAFKLGE